MNKNKLKDFNLSYSKSKSSYCDVLNHLERCDRLFKPILSSYINLDQYTKKIVDKAIRYEFFKNQTLIGLIAVYHSGNVGYITNFSLEQEFSGKGLSNELMKLCIEESKQQQISKIRLEVFKENKRAIKFYFRHSFLIEKENDKTLILYKKINFS